MNPLNVSIVCVVRWAKRLCNLPMLVGLHCQHSKRYISVYRARRALYRACAEFHEPIDSNKVIIASFAKELETELEAMADIDARMEKLWKV